MEEKLKKIKAKIQEQELKLKGLRAEEQKLGSNIRNFTKRKKILTSDVKDIQDVLLSKSAKNKVLSKEIKTLESRAKEAQTKINKAKVIFKNQEKKLIAIGGNNDKAKSSNDKNSRELDKRNKSLKITKVSQLREIGKFEKEKVRLRKNIEGIKNQSVTKRTIEQQKLKTELDIAKKNKIVMESKTRELDSHIKKIEVLKQDLKTEILNQKKSTKEYTSKISEYQNALAELSDERVNTISTRREYEGAKDLANKTIVSFNAQLRAMDTEKKELEIAELRLKKLIRDKKIDTELEKLREDLK